MIDSTKLDQLLVYMAEMGIDIVVVTETNINNKNGKFIKTYNLGYYSYWSNKDQKIKGSGVGIMISNHLQHHISQINMNAIPGYVAKITLWFKGCSLIVYGLLATKSPKGKYSNSSEVNFHNIKIILQS